MKYCNKVLELRQMDFFNKYSCLKSPSGVGKIDFKNGVYFWEKFSFFPYIYNYSSELEDI